MNMTPELHLSLRPDPASLFSVRRDVRRFLEDSAVDEESSTDIVIALQEALKNAMRFSDAEHAVELELSVVQESGYAVVRDQGGGFTDDVGRGPQFLPPPDRLALSGRGLFIIAGLMDELRLVSNGGAEVHMVKRLPPRQAEDARAAA
jgi:anti-sigma regulatory factor (Ser/Thr protein kinase)